MPTKSKKQSTLGQQSILAYLGIDGSKANNDKPKQHHNKHISRQNSILSATNNDDGFGDDSSYDTSIDTSMEMSNFKNPTLESAVLQHRANQSLSSQRTLKILGESNLVNTTQSGKDNLKRTNSDILSTFEGGQAKKVAKLTNFKSPTISQTEGTQLSTEQKSVIDSVLAGCNVFYTGSAGTGKSVVLRELVRILKSKYGDNMGVTAPTGMAACNIQGQTIFKFLEIGLAFKSAPDLANMIRKNHHKLSKWTRLRVLIIDEVSMIDGALFDKLENVARLVRKSDKPFGGIQIVCTGDFYQLPPVAVNRTAQFCFQSKSWSKVINKNIVLKQIFRQKGDHDLIEMLNALRTGELSDAIVAKFKDLSRTVHYDDGIEPTQLFPIRKEVHSANSDRLKKLSSKAYEFMAKDSHKGEHVKKQYDQLLCEETLVLKEGAQVMNIKNINDHLVNGTLGTVMFFTTLKLYLKILDIYGAIEAMDSQMLKEVKFITSRIGSVKSWTDDDRLVFQQVPDERKTHFESLVQMAVLETTANILPVVLFKLNGYDEAVLVDRQEFTVETGHENRADGNPYRAQLPLLLSWAMSIHKAQGQTLPRVKIDLNRVFENGHAYVAISRAVSRETLQVKHFSIGKVKASPIVKQFYQHLEK
ncbi:PIF1-like helicase family protein [Candida parapsilosis]|uniref:PIF1-like helicase family protein n=1 Tax=Candida parapsilosis TaxID=5480 RepID=A0A8X7TBB9_CANPA|nr:PIF1-like helicase family protein [Candida parapsilosis]KAF6053209.1 PIF1-like helicase family protein [Candida parapsilosis]